MQESNRTLPANLEAERFVLGNCVLAPELIVEFADVVNGTDFSTERDRRIWSAMRHIGRTMDRVTLTEELMRRGQLESVGGLDYLISLDEDMPQICNIHAYVKILKEKSRLRQLIFTTNAASEAAFDGNASCEELIASINNLPVSNDPKIQRAQTFAEILDENPEEFYDPSARISTGVKLPWQSLEQFVPALTAGQLVVIAARPAIGKSAAAFQIACHAAISGITALTYSLEMPKRDVMGRLVCGIAQVDTQLWQRGYLTTEQMRKFQRTADDLYKIPLYIDDRPKLTVSEVILAVKRLPVTPGLVIVDYLQLMAGAGENRNQEIEGIVRALKVSAMDLQIPFVVLSQLSREAAKPGHVPDLPDLRDSGAIEQAADVVVMLHPSADNEPLSPIARISFYIRKNKNGPVGFSTLDFFRAWTRFEDQE